MCNANIICSFCWYLGGYSIPAIASYDEKYTQRGHGFSPCPLIFLLGWCTARGCSCPSCTNRTVGTTAWLVHLRGCSCPNCTNRTIGTTAWLVHLRQVHPLKDYFTRSFFTLPSAERTMFRPFWSLESLTPSTVKSVAAPSATVVALMPVSGSGAFSPNTKLAS